MLAAACAGEEGPRETYENDVNATCRSIAEERETLPTLSEANSAARNDELARQAVAGWAALENEAIAELRAIEPPPDVERAHAVLIADFTDLFTTGRRALEAALAAEEDADEEWETAIGHLEATVAAVARVDRSADALGLDNCGDVAASSSVTQR
jgi:hypothetical protein